MTPLPIHYGRFGRCRSGCPSHQEGRLLNLPSHWFTLLWVGLCLWLQMHSPHLVCGATLADFGHQNMKVNGHLAIGQRPLLLIVASFATAPPLPNPADYDDLVFNTNRYPSLNGYFSAVSNGRLFWTRAGVVQLNLTAAERLSNTPPLYPPWSVHDRIYSSNIIYQAMASGQVNFKTFDANQDGHITQDELAILIAGNDFTGMRFAGVVPSPDGTYDWGQGSSGVGMVDFTAWPLITMCEEFEETLGCPDIYGSSCLSQGLTPQSCTVQGLYYLDPWNRMQLGWCEPRIMSLSDGGTASIPAAQLADPSAPVILYDPTRGPNEFWILEYRTPASPSGSGYDLNVAGTGLAVWHVQQDGNHLPIQVPALPPSTNTDTAVWNEGAPSFNRGSAALWGPAWTTPNLTWNDGTATATRLRIQPFQPGDGNLTVEWLPDLWGAGQCVHWVKVATGNYPGKRYSHAMAYDSDRGVVVFFGGEYSEPGSDVSSYYNDTWEFNGANWTKIVFFQGAPQPAKRSGHALAYDSAHKQVVLFGGVNENGYFNDTWVYTNDGTNAPQWIQRYVQGPAVGIAGHAMVYDRAAGLTVTAGGTYLSGPDPFDVEGSWGWDGNGWRYLGYFAGRTRFAMAYDSDRGVAVAFGGVYYIHPPIGPIETVPIFGQDEFYGSQWSRVAIGTPPLRQQHAMTYDSQRGKIILFGGTGDAGGIGDDTDEYTPGVGWSSLFSSGPPPRARHAIVYDSRRGRAVLYGGVSGDTRYDDTWELVNTGPQFQLQPANQTAQPCSAVTFTAVTIGDPPRQYQWQRDGVNLQDDGRIAGSTTEALSISQVRLVDEGVYQLVVHSPCGTNTSHGAFLKVEAAWVQHAPAVTPTGRHDGALAYDSNREVTVLFGGVGFDRIGNLVPLRDTSEWNGNSWRLRTFAGPAARWGHAMAYDTDRSRVVLFGGSISADAYDVAADTWEYDGTQWRLRATAGPGARLQPAMAYDGAKRSMVLVGGSANGGGSRLTDTWTYNGDSGIWSPVANTWPAPVPVGTQRMVYDANRQKLVLVDLYAHGLGTEQLRVFEWDRLGPQWVQQAPGPDPDPAAGPNAIPLAVNGFGLAYDSQRRMVVLNNGEIAGYYPQTTWGYDGTNWHRLPGGGPGPVAGGALAYDSARYALVEFGGWNNVTIGYYWDQTWELIRDDGPALVQQPIALRGPSGVVQISEIVRGRAPYQFQWRSNGIPLIESGPFSGTTNGTLAVSGPVSGRFDVQVTTPCGQVLSDSVNLPLPSDTTFNYGSTRLHITNGSSGQATITWPDPSAQLYSGPTPTGPWSPVPGASSPYVIPAATAPAFFKLFGGSGCADMPAGLVSWWRAEGDASDYTGKAPGTAFGVGFVPGQVGQAFNFNTIGQGIALAASGALDVSTNEGFSIEAWVNPADNQWLPIMEWRAVGGFDIGAHFWIGVSAYGIGGPGCLFAGLNGYGDPSSRIISLPGLVTSNAWQHVAFTYQARDPVFGTMRLYLNGEVVAVQPVAGPSVQTRNPVYLGVRPGQYSFRGLMDEVTLYNRALSQDELRAIYFSHAGKCLP